MIAPIDHWSREPDEERMIGLRPASPRERVESAVDGVTPVLILLVGRRAIRADGVEIGFRLVGGVARIGHLIVDGYAELVAHEGVVAELQARAEGEGELPIAVDIVPAKRAVDAVAAAHAAPQFSAQADLLGREPDVGEDAALKRPARLV